MRTKDEADVLTVSLHEVVGNHFVAHRRWKGQHYACCDRDWDAAKGVESSEVKVLIQNKRIKAD